MPRSRSHQARFGGRAWQRIRHQILARDAWVCQLCGAHASQVDHILRRRDGGGHDPANLRAVCAPCNTTRELGAAQVARVARIFQLTPTETRPISADSLPKWDAASGINRITGELSRDQPEDG